MRGPCGRTASDLVDVLIRSSVQLSPLCTADMTPQTLAVASTTVTHLITAGVHSDHPWQFVFLTLAYINVAYTLVR